MPRLVFAFVVQKPLKTGFLASRPILMVVKWHFSDDFGIFSYWSSKHKLWLLVVIALIMQFKRVPKYLTKNEYLILVKDSSGNYLEYALEKR